MTPPHKIKVVFGLNDLTVGGAQKQFIEQAKLHDRKRFDIVLVTLFQFPDRVELYDEVPHDVQVHRLHFTGFFNIKSWWELYMLLQNLRPHVVVSGLFFSNTVFRVLKPFIGYASIACEHNTYAWKPALHIFVDRVLSKLSYRIVAVSKTVADFTAKQEHISRDTFVVIHNGVDVSGIRKRLESLPSKEEIRRQLGLPVAGKVILNVARLTPQKNHALLIDGFSLFHSKHPTYVLAIVGDGTLKETLEKRVRGKGLETSIIFFGLRRDVWNFYKGSDIFILTSDIEGFGIVCAEALASGLPLVSTKTAGPDEMIEPGKNGAFIHEHTAEKVCEALEAVVESDYKAMKARSEHDAEKFDIHTTVEKYEHLFSKAHGKV